MSSDTATTFATTQPLVVVNGAPADKGSSFADGVLPFASSLLWPLLLAYVVYHFKNELKELLKALAKLVESRDLLVKVGSIEITRKVRSAMMSNAESLSVDREVLSTPAYSVESVAKAESKLAAIAADYEGNTIADYAQRLLKKESDVAQMARIIIDARLDRAKLAENPLEGVRAGLATAIHACPNPGDDKVLLQAGAGVERLHVCYRIMMAVSRLANLREIDASRFAPFRELAISYRVKADRPLLDRIQRTLDTLDLAQY